MWIYRLGLKETEQFFSQVIYDQEFKYFTKKLSHLMITKWSVADWARNRSTRAIWLLMISAHKLFFCNKSKILQGLNIYIGKQEWYLRFKPFINLKSPYVLLIEWFRVGGMIAEELRNARQNSQMNINKLTYLLHSWFGGYIFCFNFSLLFKWLLKS